MKTTETGGVVRLDYDGIERVERKETKRWHVGDYSERPSPYMVQLVGEKRLRRVYQIGSGHGAVHQYIKTKYRTVFVEAALDAALHRQNWVDFTRRAK